MEKKITYLDRDYPDYKNSLIEFSKTYYPDLATSFNDASVGAWLIDLNAVIADELSYHIDRTFQETNINSANQVQSVYALARNSGFKIPGPKGAMAEVAFSCILPLSGTEPIGTLRGPNWNYAPIIKKGTKVSSSSQIFELMTDVDFSKQFNEDGVSDRTVYPNRNSNGLIVSYTVKKLAVVVAGETRIYKKAVAANDIVPFMEVLIPIENVMSVESVIVKEGSVFQSNPKSAEFFIPEETSSTYTTTTRFFEVDYLAQQERWGEVVNEGKPVVTEYGYLDDDMVIPCYSVTHGEWKPLKHKFITEYTDAGYLKVVFGAGLEKNTTDTVDISDASDYAKNQISKMIHNNSLGYLPKPNSTIFILYRVGGGKASNVAAGAINNMAYLNFEARQGNASEVSAIRNSIRVESTTPSVSGKDMPTPEEVRNMVKYNNGAQNRCVTVKDYISRVLLMPAKYGTPFRVSGAEANNKVMLYLLGIDYLGHLDATLPVQLVKNIRDYLAYYRTLNDYVEIKSGRIINLSFEIDVFVDKEYNKSDVVTQVTNIVKKYMDINSHEMGDDIFVGDIEREISNVDGVLNLIDLRVYNNYGPNYSKTQTNQQTVVNGTCDEYGNQLSEYQDCLQIDLDASDKMLISDGDCMFEVKYPETDIRVRIKER